MVTTCSQRPLEMDPRISDISQMSAVWRISDGVVKPYPHDWPSSLSCLSKWKKHMQWNEISWWMQSRSRYLVGQKRHSYVNSVILQRMWRNPSLLTSTQNSGSAHAISYCFLKLWSIGMYVRMWRNWWTWPSLLQSMVFPNCLWVHQLDFNFWH